MKRITVGKKEQIAELIERIIEDPDEEIVLVVSKGTSLGASVSNFHLLAREAKATAKQLVIESVDDSILALAKSSDIPARHPFFSPEGNAVADIVPRAKIAKLDDVSEEESSSEDEEPQAVLAKASLSRRRKSARTQVESLESDEEDLLDVEVPRGRFRSRFTPKFFIIIVAILAVLFGGVFAIDHVFGKATVEVTFNKVSWSYTHSFTADVAVSPARPADAVLPGALFTLSKNTTQFFHASLKKQVSQKATGKMFIYNAYGSSPQSLVASTRFQTPDGKMFRIPAGVTVPGAQIQSGKIIPSRIEVDIVADKSGPDYNVGPVSKLTIPGFANTPKYAAFYGEIQNKTSGGFIGKRAVPSDADIAAGKDKTTVLLTTTLESSFTTTYPPGIVVPPGASHVAITRINVNPNTDDQGNFSIFGEANMTALGFKSSDLQAILLSAANQTNTQSAFHDIALTYANVLPDFTKKRMTFDLSATGTLWTDFSANDFAESLAGKSLGEARSIVASLPGLSNAKISLWPIWLGSLPGNADKINVSVQ